MSKSCLRFRNGTLPVESLFFALLTAFIASAQATDASRQIRLVLGESNTAFSPGTVIVTRFGHIRGEDEAFPAISSDHGQIAILHVDDPHDPSVSLMIVSAESRKIAEHFELVLADERGKALSADDRDIALTELEDRICDRLEIANQYLSELEFHSIPELYNIRNIYTGGYFSLEDDERPRIWENEGEAWVVNYDFGSEKLEISSTKTGNVALRVKRPIEVYGIASPGVLCRVRPTPYRGWYDEGSDTAIIRLGYFWGGHGCDVSDKWLIETLESP